MAIGRRFKIKTGIIVIAAIISILLYMAGVLSGLYANKIVREETNQNIQTLKQETKQDLEGLQNYIDFLDKNFKNMQLEQTFIETLTPVQICNYSTISMNNLIAQLGFYWERLPFRIEEYEKDNPKLPEEYLILKQQYTHLSIRTWILAKNLYDKCDMDMVQGLYFYSAGCSNCVEQGMQLDELNKMVRAAGRDMILFPVDFNSDDILIKNLREYYGITSVPAIIINDKVFQGRLFTAKELIPYKRNGKDE